ncbi:MAG: hypothetical protein JXR51_08355 [Bacteroidales bacterium]|nr:hypothetical protein [Bacteroidales bacterium]
MKTGTLNIKRDIQPSKIIEDTHHVEETPKKEYGQVGYRKRKSKKETFLKAVRFNEKQFSKLDSYLEENDLGFSEFIKDLLKEKGIF